MKMGTIASPLRYDAAVGAPRTYDLRRPAIFRYASSRLYSRFRRVVWSPFD